MKRFTVVLIILFSFTIGVLAQKQEFRKVENKAFRAGEKLTYKVKYGFVTAGYAEMAIPKMVKISGRDAYNVTFKVSSVPAFDAFYKVRDRYETFIDVEGIFPWRFEQHIREGSYSYDFSAFFDQRKGKAKTSEGTFDIPPYINDIVSALYWARTINYSKMKTGDVVKLQNFSGKYAYPLDIVVRGKERIEVEAGTFDCVIVEPIVKEGGLFKSEGDILVWVTDDDLKVPVRVKSKVIIGSIDAELETYEGLAGAFKAKR